MVLANADVIDAAEFLLGPAEPPEDTAALATFPTTTIIRK